MRALVPTAERRTNCQQNQPRLNIPEKKARSNKKHVTAAKGNMSTRIIVIFFKI